MLWESSPTPAIYKKMPVTKDHTAYLKQQLSLALTIFVHEAACFLVGQRFTCLGQGEKRHLGSIFVCPTYYKCVVWEMEGSYGCMYSVSDLEKYVQ